MSAANGARAAAGPRRFRPYPTYKDSGVEWLGEIPAHWEVKRLKTVASVQLSNVDKKSLEGQEPVRLCNYVDVYYHERITSDPDFMVATATPEQIRLFALRTGYHLAHIRPQPACHGAFLSRAFSAIGPRDQFQVAANGILDPRGGPAGRQGRNSRRAEDHRGVPQHRRRRPLVRRGRRRLHRRHRARPAVVSCRRSPEPVFLKWKGMEAVPHGDFFVRSGPGTVKLSPDSAQEYIRTRFPS